MCQTLCWKLETEPWAPHAPHPERACRLVEGADRTLLLDPQGGRGAEWAVVRGGFLKEMPRS